MVLEFADRAFEVDAVAQGQGFHGLGHFPAFDGFGVEVDFHEHVQEAGLRGLGDGCVGADDGFAGDGVAEADHEVLTDG